MMADVIDYDEYLTNERRECQFEVFHLLIPKFVEVPSRSIPFMVLAHSGFVPKTTAGYTDQNDEVMTLVHPRGVALESGSGLGSGLGRG